MRWDGLFTVIQKFSHLYYLVRRSAENHTVFFHVNHMKKWKSKGEAGNESQKLAGNTQDEESGEEEAIGEYK